MPFIKKPELPKEVAKAIEFFKNGGGDGSVLFDMDRLEHLATIAPSGNKNSRAIYEYIKESPENQRRFFAALAIGYEVEKSPEEKALDEARNYYKESVSKYYNTKIGTKEESYYKGVIHATREYVDLGLLDESIVN